MEKVTRILAVVEGSESGFIVLDKTVAMARCFGALVELLVAEVSHARVFAAACRERGYDDVTLISMHRGRSSMHECILRRTYESLPDLVVKAPAGAHSSHDWTLDREDWMLAHECPVPVLLVRERPWTKPVRFGAAVDVSDDDTADVARSILHTAGFLAMGLDGALDILYSEREKHDEALRMERAVKLAQLVREFHVGCERIQVLSGRPEEVLVPLVAARQYDVLVLGAESRRPLGSVIHHGTVGRLIESSNGDVVLVKAPTTEMNRDIARRKSGVEQRPDEVEQFV